MLRQEAAQPWIVAVAQTIGIALVSLAEDHHHSLLLAVAPNEHDMRRQWDHVPMDGQSFHRERPAPKRAKRERAFSNTGKVRQVTPLLQSV